MTAAEMDSLEFFCALGLWGPFRVLGLSGYRVSTHRLAKQAWLGLGSYGSRVVRRFRAQSLQYSETQRHSQHKKRGDPHSGQGSTGSGPPLTQGTN